MKVLYVLCAVLYALSFTPVSAAGEPLPASLYPAGSVLSVEPALTNDAYDCDWGLDCTSWAPVFHTQSSSLLGRTGGWAEWGHKGKKLYFVLFASTLTDNTAVSGMFLDLQSQLKANHFHVAKQHETLPASSTVWRTKSGPDTITVIATQLDGRLIEAAELHNRAAYPQSQVMGFLVRQVEAAETATIPDATTPGS